MDACIFGVGLRNTKKKVGMSDTTNLSPAPVVRDVAAANRAMAFWHTMIGKKVVMAVTGVVLVGFVIAHMLGNLKIFSGATEIDAYSRFLREVGSAGLAYGQLLWIARIVLLTCVALHITAAVQLSRMSWAAPRWVSG